MVGSMAGGVQRVAGKGVEFHETGWGELDHAAVGKGDDVEFEGRVVRDGLRRGGALDVQVVKRFDLERHAKGQGFEFVSGTPKREDVVEGGSCEYLQEEN